MSVESPVDATALYYGGDVYTLCSISYNISKNTLHNVCIIRSPESLVEKPQNRGIKILKTRHNRGN